jgi:hypothetical protein
LAAGNGTEGLIRHIGLHTCPAPLPCLKDL